MCRYAQIYYNCLEHKAGTCVTTPCASALSSALASVSEPDVSEVLKNLSLTTPTSTSEHGPFTVSEPEVKPVFNASSTPTVPSVSKPSDIPQSSTRKFSWKPVVHCREKSEQLEDKWGFVVDGMCPVCFPQIPDIPVLLREKVTVGVENGKVVGTNN